MINKVYKIWEYIFTLIYIDTHLLLCLRGSPCVSCVNKLIVAIFGPPWSQTVTLG